MDKNIITKTEPVKLYWGYNKLKDIIQELTILKDEYGEDAYLNLCFNDYLACIEGEVSYRRLETDDECKLRITIEQEKLEKEKEYIRKRAKELGM